MALLYKGVAATSALQRVPMHKAAAVVTSRLLSLMALLLPVSALAQATINIPRDQPTIQAGISAASDGDTILVAPGKYVENIDFLGKAIIVTSSGGAASTIIDGGAAGPAVTFQTSESRASVLSGMTIQNAGGYGANTTAVGIAGVVVSNSSPTILNNIITKNQCWGIEVLYGAPLIQGNTISSTQSPAGGCGPSSGAGIYIGGNLDGDASTDDGNAAVVRGNTIENNTVPGSLNVSSASTNMDDSNGGAGITVFDGSPLIENNILRNNAAPGGNGGAINIAGGFGVTIAQNLIYGNIAGCGGGAISFTGGYTGTGPYLLAANNTIVDNTGGSGGPYASCGDVSQIYGSDFGLSSPNVIFVNNIVSGNSAAAAIGCLDTVASPDEALQSIFDHNLLFNAGGSIFGPTCVDVSSKYGNLSVAPEFVNPNAGDYRIATASPGIDIGNNSALGNVSELSGTNLTTDLDGNPRVQDATGIGYPVIDVGVYEHAGAVDGSPTTIVLTSSTYSGSPGDPMTLTGTFASALGVPTGSATFFLDGQSIGVSMIESTRTATLDTVLPPPGVHSLYLTYSGEGSFTPARSVVIIVSTTGNTFATTLEFGANVEYQAYGQDVVFTAIVSSTDPNPAFVPSPVTLTLDAGVLASLTPNREGIARFTTSTLPFGFDQIIASYAGDATHEAATASYTVGIYGGISTTSMLSCGSALIGQTQLITAKVSADTGIPTGSVIFNANGQEFAEVEASNAGQLFPRTAQASATYRGQAAGPVTFSARFTADPPYYSSAGICYGSVMGLPSSSVLSVTPATGPFLTSTSMVATVSPLSPPALGTPTGTVSFVNGSNALGTANLTGGVAELSTIALPAGTDPVSCLYSGDSNYAPSDCNTVLVTRSVAQPALTITPSANPASALTQVTFIVKLTSTGKPAPMDPVVLFSISGQTLPLTLTADGTAEYVTSSLLPGTYPVTASFAGNANLLSASASLTEFVVSSPSTTALSVAPNPGYLGQSVTLAAMISVQDTLVPAGGTVTFYDGTTILGTGVLDQARTATLTTNALAVGTHALTATYPGTAVFTVSISPPVIETILASGFTIALSPGTVTVLPDQTATVAIQLASSGGFTGPLTLSYGTLPVNASASILPQIVTLTPNGTASATLTLNTVSQPVVTANRSARRSSPRATGWTALLAALILIFPARRRLKVRFADGRIRSFLWLALTAALLQTVTGCGNRFYTLTGVAPGTYQIPVTATDVNQNKQTAVLTLVVPPQ